MPWNRIGDGRNLVSTYQQVLENMRYIQEDILPKIDVLNDTIFNPDDDGAGNKSDITLDGNDNMKVAGVTIILDNKDTNIPPSGYSRNVSYELKKTSVVGLSGVEGFSQEYTLVKTVWIDVTDGVEYPARQTAYGDDTAVYCRKATTGDQWGEWVSMMDIKKLLNENEALIKQLVGKQFIQSDEQPADNVQVAGDFWMQPIHDVEGYFLQSVDEPSVIHPITEASEDDYQMQSVDNSGTTVNAPNIGDFAVESDIT